MRQSAELKATVREQPSCEFNPVRLSYCFSQIKFVNSVRL
jgi:hypothetical protein